MAPQEDLPPAHHQRQNSEKLSPEASLPVKLEVKTRAHRQMGRGMSGDFGGETATSIANFNIYHQGAQGREWELQHVAARQDIHTYQQHYSSRQEARGQGHPRLDPRLTARSLATNSTTGQRLGLPFNSIQRTAPKGDKISLTLASQATQHSREKSTVPLTTNSNFTSAVIRTNQPGGSGMRYAASTPFQQGRSRTSSTSSSSTAGNSAIRRCLDGDALGNSLLPTFAPPDLSSRATSPSLDGSIQTLLRRSSSSEESDIGDFGNRHHRSWSYSSSSSPSRQAQGRSQKSRLTSDVLSPTSSTCSPSRLRTGSDPYGPRNLGSVAGRTSTSVTAVPGVKGAVVNAGGKKDKKAPAARPHYHRRGYTTSSGFLGQLRESSLNLLVNMGILTPPAPPQAESRYFPPVPHPALTLSARHPDRHSRSSTATSASLVGGSMEYSLDSSNNIWLSSSVSRKNERVRADTGSSLDNSLTSVSSGLHHQRLSSFSYPSKSSKAKEDKSKETVAAERARTALQVIIERIMNAQGNGKEATTWEVHKFLEGGGVEALVRGIETLGHDPGLAFNLLYVLRVVLMDPEARRQAVSSAKGHILLEHVPSVMGAHLSSTPIFRDGLSVMTILLSDPVTVNLARNLMLTPSTLEMVSKVRDVAPSGSREEKLCSEFLARAASSVVHSS